MTSTLGLDFQILRFIKLPNTNNFDSILAVSYSDYLISLFFMKTTLFCKCITRHMNMNKI